MLEWLSEYDMVFISEVKRRVSDVPGFTVYEARNEKYSRGGLVLLLKTYLVPDISKMDDSINEQLWVELKSLPNVVFGGMYIPPSDSIYYRGICKVCQLL